MKASATGGRDDSGPPPQPRGADSGRAGSAPAARSPRRSRVCGRARAQGQRYEGDQRGDQEGLVRGPKLSRPGPPLTTARAAGGAAGASPSRCPRRSPRRAQRRVIELRAHSSEAALNAPRASVNTRRGRRSASEPRSAAGLAAPTRRRRSPGGPLEAGAERALDRRQRDVHDRDVEQQHERRKAAGEERLPPGLGAAPRGARGRRATGACASDRDQNSVSIQSIIERSSRPSRSIWWSLPSRRSRSKFSWPARFSATHSRANSPD
jgi:hypothetical protein